MPSYYTDEDAFINDVVLAKQEAQGLVSRNDANVVEKGERDRRVEHEIQNKVDYYRLSFVPEGFCFGDITAKDTYINVVYKPTEDVRFDLSSCIIIYYYEQSQTSGTELLMGFSHAYNEFYQYEVEKQGNSYYFFDLGVGKKVWWNTEEKMLAMGCPASWTDEEMINLTKQVERVVID